MRSTLPAAPPGDWWVKDWELYLLQPNWHGDESELNPWIGMRSLPLRRKILWLLNDNNNLVCKLTASAIADDWISRGPYIISWYFDSPISRMTIFERTTRKNSYQLGWLISSRTIKIFRYNLRSALIDIIIGDLCRYDILVAVLAEFQRWNCSRRRSAASRGQHVLLSDSQRHRHLRHVFTAQQG